ncbi:MAG: DNA-binding domain-containing protein [Gallionellaceae bacterium]|jgi:hypothetical protein
MSVLALTKLQEAFHDHLLDQPSAIAQEVMSGGRISVDHRLNIYHNAYRIRLLENMRDAYEKTWAYLGDETFDSSALAFIEKYPPRHRNLRWHGAEFPQWLEQLFPADTDIGELARVDWQLRQAFDGPDATPIKPEDFTGLASEDWETIAFQFAPTMQLSPLRYNTVSIWHALDQEQIPPVAEDLPASSWLLIWRKGWQPHFRVIGEVEYAALVQLQQGISFAQVCASLSLQFSDTEAATVAAENLRVWLDDEMIVGITVGQCLPTFSERHH